MTVIMSRFLLCIFVQLLFVFFIPTAFAALPSSTNYKIQSYSFGGGGTRNSTSTNYSLFGISGDITGKTSSTTYTARNGLNYMLQVNVPTAPTVSNPGTTYDRLKLVINTSSNPTDATYAVSISSDNFVSDIRFVKSDNTVGSTLAISDYRTYTNWGAASGVFVTTLKPNTTYYFKVKARQGKYAESNYGPVASVATSNPTLTFALSSSTLTFQTPTAGNNYTDSSESTTVTTSTNAYNGYSVYAHETQSLTAPGGKTIADYTSPNSAPTTWSGTGFGYTTNDTNLTGSGGVNRFASATKYAGFTQAQFGDIVADDTGPVQSSPISNEQFTISYRVTVTGATQAGTYTNTIIYAIAAAY